MKKRFFSFLFPVLIAVTCSVAVWANEQSAKPTPCEKCAQAKPVQKGCDKCAQKDGAAAMPCGAKECEKCAQAKKVDGAPGAAKGCDNCPNLKKTEPKPCCNKEKL